MRQRVDELIELFGLGAFRSRFVRELSTGSRRVVDLACVVAHRPTVVLLDEPSSGIAQRETEALGPAAASGCGTASAPPWSSSSTTSRWSPAWPTGSSPWIRGPSSPTARPTRC